MSRFSRKLIAAAVVAATLTFVSGSARADCGCRGGLNGSYGFGYSGSLYGLGYIPVPPYFALHPPVYYGERVRRSYGRSPYAAMPARVQAPKAKPQLVINSTMKKAAPKPEAKATASQTAARPQLILNPFVEPKQLVSDSK